MTSPTTCDLRSGCCLATGTSTATALLSTYPCLCPVFMTLTHIIIISSYFAYMLSFLGSVFFALEACSMCFWVGVLASFLKGTYLMVEFKKWLAFFLSWPGTSWSCVYQACFLIVQQSCLKKNWVAEGQPGCEKQGCGLD